MDPFEMLEHDHRVVESLFKDFENTKSDKKKKQVFEQIKLELTKHAEAEEKAVYPKLETKKKTEEITYEGYEEHHVIEILLQEAANLDPSDEEFLAKVNVMKENVEHHVEEEEKDMFPNARKVLSKSDQATIAEEIERIKGEAERMNG